MAFFPHQPLVRALEACVCAGVDVGKNLASFLLQLPPGQNFPRVPDNVEFHQGEGSAGMRALLLEGVGRSMCVRYTAESGWLLSS